MATRRRRATSEAERRRHVVSVSLNDAELALLDAARSAGGSSRGRWLWMAAEAELGRGPSPGEVAERGGLIGELIASRVALDQIGNNLNQAVKVLHSTGDVEPRQLQAILDRVERAVTRVENAADATEDRRGRRR